MCTAVNAPTQRWIPPLCKKKQFLRGISGTVTLHEKIFLILGTNRSSLNSKCALLAIVFWFLADISVTVTIFNFVSTRVLSSNYTFLGDFWSKLARITYTLYLQHWFHHSNHIKAVCGRNVQNEQNVEKCRGRRQHISLQIRYNWRGSQLMMHIMHRLLQKRMSWSFRYWINIVCRQVTGHGSPASCAN